MMFLKKVFRDTLEISYDIFKLLIPVSIVVKCLEELGVVAHIAVALDPLMNLFGLPGSLALVFAAGLLVNLLAALVVFGSLLPELSITTAQATVLGSMMLIAHALPMEMAMFRKAGLRLRLAVPFRLCIAAIYGLLLHQLFSGAQLLQGPAIVGWMPEATDPSLVSWVIRELKTYLFFFLILLGLTALLELLKRWNAIDAITALLRPLSRVLRISHTAMTLIIVSMLLGSVYGCALFIQEARNGNLSERDICTSLILLLTCHGLFEETIVIGLMGGNIWVLLFGRLLLSVSIAIAAAVLFDVISQGFRRRHLFRPLSSS